MSANYQSKLYHKIILLKPANTQLFELFCLNNNSVYSSLRWRDHYTLDPELTSQIQRGLTRSRTWSHTRWCVLFFFTLLPFFFLFFLNNGSVTHIFAHTCTRARTDMLSTTNATRRGFWNAARSRLRHAGSVASSQRFMLRSGITAGPAECWLASRCSYTPGLSSPSPLSRLPPPHENNRPGAGNDKMSARSGRFDVLHLLPQLLLSNEAQLKCQTN